MKYISLFHFEKKVREKKQGFADIPSQVLEPGLNYHYWLIKEDEGVFDGNFFLHIELSHSKKDASTPELKDSEE